MPSRFNCHACTSMQLNDNHIWFDLMSIEKRHIAWTEPSTRAVPPPHKHTHTACRSTHAPKVHQLHLISGCFCFKKGKVHVFSLRPRICIECVVHRGCLRGWSGSWSCRARRRCVNFPAYELSSAQSPLLQGWCLRHKVSGLISGLRRFVVFNTMEKCGFQLG